MARLVNMQKAGKNNMEFLVEGILALTWQQVVMYAIGILLIWLAIKKEYEPALLLPMGFGAILVNLPFTGVITQELAGVGEVTGIIEWLFDIGIEASEAMPILLFIGIGAMIDFVRSFQILKCSYSVRRHSSAFSLRLRLRLCLALI